MSQPNFPLFYLRNDVKEQLLLTSSVRGVCRLWRGLRNAGAAYNLVFECVTAKEQIATSCALMGDRCLIIGDSRGGISIFKWRHDSGQIAKVISTSGPHIFSLPSTDTYQHNPAKEDVPADLPKRLSVDTYIPHAHGSDLVSNIREDGDGGGFYSIGHDGFFCIFSSAGRLISKLKCLPIKSPDKIFVVGSGKEKSYYIGGFLGGLYLVYDIRRGYQLLRIEGGGWKR